MLRRSVRHWAPPCASSRMRVCKCPHTLQTYLLICSICLMALNKTNLQQDMRGSRTLTAVPHATATPHLPVLRVLVNRNPERAGLGNGSGWLRCRWPQARHLRKKLQQMEALEARRRGGAALDPQQAAKVAQRTAVQAALDALSGGATVASLQVLRRTRALVNPFVKEVVPSCFRLISDIGHSQLVPADASSGCM